MTCDNKSSLPDTIISRATVYSLEPPTKEECAAALEERFPEVSAEEAKLASIAFGGNFGAAFEAIESGKTEIIKLAARTPELLGKGKTYEFAAELSSLASDRNSLAGIF